MTSVCVCAIICAELEREIEKGVFMRMCVSEGECTREGCVRVFVCLCLCVCVCVCV